MKTNSAKMTSVKFAKNNTRIPQEIIDKINKAHKEVQIAQLEIANHRRTLNKYKVAHKYNEYGLQRVVSEYLTVHNIKHNKEYTVGKNSRIDILTNHSIIEIKYRADRVSIYSAIGQLFYYESCLNKHGLDKMIITYDEPSEYSKVAMESLGIKHFRINEIEQESFNGIR